VALSDAPKQECTYQLLYISAARHEFTEQELGDLLNLARARNQEKGVTGMLIYHEGSFIQALEGERAVVERLYEKIGMDSRHTESRVLFRGEIPHRDFENWSMGFYRSEQSKAENLEGFHQFLTRGFKNSDEDNNSSLARKALLAFREGSWRQHA